MNKESFKEIEEALVSFIKRVAKGEIIIKTKQKAPSDRKELNEKKMILGPFLYWLYTHQTATTVIASVLGAIIGSLLISLLKHLL